MWSRSHNACGELHLQPGVFAEDIDNERVSIMLSRDSAEWSNLRHAYGSGSEIPELLRSLEMCPTSDGEHGAMALHLEFSRTPRRRLLSVICGGSTYCPNLVYHADAVLRTTSFRFPAWIEICRQRANISVPVDLSPAYFEALSKLPELVGAATARECDFPSFLAAARDLVLSSGSSIGTRSCDS